MNLEIFSKWEKTKLLESAKTQQSKEKLAQLLENQKTFNDSYQMPEGVNVAKDLFNRLSIPLVSKIFGNFIFSELIGFNVLSTPSELFKYRDSLNSLKTIEAVARTRWMKTTWKQNTLEDLYKKNVTGLDAESEWFSDYLCENVNLDIQQEILKDLYKVAPYNVNLYWRNVNNLVDTILITSSSIEKTINRSANWIIVPIEIYKELKESSDFDPGLEFDFNFKKVQKVGRLSNKWNVYVDPNVEDLEILLGYKGEEFDTGYFYFPYIVLSGMAKVEVENMDNDYPMFYRYFKALPNKNYYSKIIISGYSAKK